MGKIKLNPTKERQELNQILGEFQGPIMESSVSKIYESQMPFLNKMIAHFNSHNHLFEYLSTLLLKEHLRNNWKPLNLFGKTSHIKQEILLYLEKEIQEEIKGNQEAEFEFREIQKEVEKLEEIIDGEISKGSEDTEPDWGEVFFNLFFLQSSSNLFLTEEQALLIMDFVKRRYAETHPIVLFSIAKLQTSKILSTFPELEKKIEEHPIQYL